ncbi:uncharacterized protein [Antennarius striatus]|uniref:uncharacterized protein n=1 Tax=Antennarius striatus TaxID=241820 RepID=UPI0035AE7439
MKMLCLVLFFHASFQLQCDRQITAPVGGEFRLACKYNNQFLYNKKYWCRGESRITCVILVDSEGVTRGENINRFHIADLRRRGLYVRVTGLQFDDTGDYWVGIEKIYNDVMTSVKILITEVPVSKPRIWPLIPLVDRTTCRGQPVTVRCVSSEGTAVDYTWYKRSHHQDVLLHRSSDLHLQCDIVDQHSHFYCTASNNVSNQTSDDLWVQDVTPADSSCIYIINMQGQPIYDCVDRTSTINIKTPPLATLQTTMKIHSDARNQSFQINQTDCNPIFIRSWIGMPFWYTLLRWSSFVILLIFFCKITVCTKARHV